MPNDLNKGVIIFRKQKSVQEEVQKIKTEDFKIEMKETVFETKKAWLFTRLSAHKIIR
jgi:hypothetical protein